MPLIQNSHQPHIPFIISCEMYEKRKYLVSRFASIAITFNSFTNDIHLVWEYFHVIDFDLGGTWEGELGGKCSPLDAPLFFFWLKSMAMHFFFCMKNVIFEFVHFFLHFSRDLTLPLWIRFYVAPKFYKGANIYST